jgi:hypothetical protein
MIYYNLVCFEIIIYEIYRVSFSLVGTFFQVL